MSAIPPKADIVNSPKSSVVAVLVGCGHRAAPPQSVPLANFHKSPTAHDFAIAASNLSAVFTPKLVALGCARLKH